MGKKANVKGMFLARLFNDLLHPAHLSILQPHFYAVRMVGRACQDFLDNPASPLACSLVFLEDDLNT